MKTATQQEQHSARSNAEQVRSVSRAFPVIADRSARSSVQRKLIADVYNTSAQQEKSVQVPLYVAPVQLKSSAVIQMVCEKCGDTKHKTSKCTKSKADLEAHKEEVAAFHAAKQEKLEAMMEAEKAAGGRKKAPAAAATSAFASKHVAPKGRPIERAADEVARSRAWGAGGGPAAAAAPKKSTVVDISEEDLAKEGRFAMESLKFSEADMTGEEIAPRFGVNKATKFNYRTLTSEVRPDGRGGRAVAAGEEELARPVLGMRGDQIHHLHGVEKEAEKED